MAIDQYYEKVAGDEDSGNPLVGGERATRRAPPSSTHKRSLLTKVALGAIAVTVFIAAVALVSSAVVSYRLPAAAEAALAKASGTTSSALPASTAADKEKTGGFEGMEDGTGDKDATSTISAPISTATDSIFFNASHHQPLRECGGTPEEARANGCVYDVMMQLWTPPECMDAPLSERYLEAGNWTWYANADASRIYTDEEIRKGEHDVVYVAQSYHRHHCIFAWERLVRAMRNQGPLITELISYDHVMHCRHKTLTLPEEGAEDVRGVIAPTGYTKCASYDVWIQNLPFNKMSSSD